MTEKLKMEFWKGKDEKSREKERRGMEGGSRMEEGGATPTLLEKSVTPS